MKSRLLAAVFLIVGALAPALLGFVSPLGWAHVQAQHLVHSVLLLLAAAGLMAQLRWMRWPAALLSGVFAILAVGTLAAAPHLPLWEVVPAPRADLAYIAVLAVATTLATLLLLHPAAATEGPAPSGRSIVFGGLVTICLLGIAYLGWQAERWYPRMVIDQVGLLEPAEQRRLARYHGLLREDYDIDYRLILGRDLGDLDLFSARRFQALDIGRASKRGRGLLLVIDTAANEIRMEVGRSLEPVYVDGLVAYIEQRQMTEFFAAGRVAHGILAATEMLVTRAQNAAENAGFADELWVAGSGGGGARTGARIDEGRSEPRSQSSAAAPASDSPRAVLEAYRRAMRARNDNPDLNFYSHATRTMNADWVITPAQMDNVAKSLDGCDMKHLDQRSGRAVLRAAFDERQCSPYFFIREEGRWRLDLRPMRDVLRFNHRNQWRLNLAADTPYRFAFADWIFGPNGFPTAILGNKKLIEQARNADPVPLYVYADGEYRTVRP